MRLPQARLDQVLDRFHEVEARMGAATDGAEIVRLSKEHAELKPVADAVQGLARARAEMVDLEAMAEDPEMADMAAASASAEPDMAESNTAAPKPLCCVCLPIGWAMSRINGLLMLTTNPSTKPCWPSGALPAPTT